MVAGGVVGSAAVGPTARSAPSNCVPIFDLVGTMFINLLKMLIVPLILASVITGVAAARHRA